MKLITMCFTKALQSIISVITISH